jgi:hypothetical protein
MAKCTISVIECHHNGNFSESIKRVTHKAEKCRLYFFAVYKGIQRLKKEKINWLRFLAWNLQVISGSKK